MLTNLTQLKQFLNLTTTSEDDRLCLLIAQVSDFIENWCGRTFVQATYTEYYSGQGKPFLVLNQRPVASITSVYLDDQGYWGQGQDAFATADLLQSGVDYALDIGSGGLSYTGRLLKVKGDWPNAWAYWFGVISSLPGPDIGNIKVTYVGGFNANLVPKGLQLACHMAIALIRNGAAFGQPMQSESFEEYSYTLQGDVSQAIFSPQVLSILARYRSIPVA